VRALVAIDLDQLVAQRACRQINVGIYFIALLACDIRAYG
jgi:hypothetical protein